MPTKKPIRKPRAIHTRLIVVTSVLLVSMALLLSVALSGASSWVSRSSYSGAPVDAVPGSEAPGLPVASPVTESPSVTTIGPSRETIAPSKKPRGILVFVIDDVGHNTWQLQPFLELPFPITLSVLPGLPLTGESVAMIQKADKELMLHQPMEALNGLDPGPGAIRADMDDNIIRQTLRQNLAQVPGAAGMNNHMGSKATSDSRVMSTILDETAAAGIYFLDSLTVGDSVVHSVASLMRQSTWERTVFLDNTPDKASMLHYIAEGTKTAEKRGYAIMIGHVWSAQLAQTLADLYPSLVEQGFSLSTISRIMMDADDDDDSGD